MAKFNEIKKSIVRLVSKAKEFSAQHKLITIGIFFIIVIVILGISVTVTNANKRAYAEKQALELSLQVLEEVEEVIIEPVIEEVIKEELEEPKEDIEEVIEPIGPISKLSGLVISEEAYNRRPIGIMISNIKVATPQYGISQADIIYETLVEGGIARMFAVFQEFDASKIGPLRSSRHYFLDFALDHDALYLHFGESPQAKKAFKELDVDRFSGINTINGTPSVENIVSFQDPDRKRPHSTFTGFDYLMDAWEFLDYRVEPKEMEPKFHFNKEEVELVQGTDLKYLYLDYSYYQKPWFEYDEELKLYKRFQFDAEQIDANTNEQLTFKNIIVQFASIWAISGDSEGRLDMNLITTGEGMYITNGKMIPITWEKTSHYDPTQYYVEDGSVLLMNPGKTFVSVYPINRRDKIIME